MFIIIIMRVPSDVLQRQHRRHHKVAQAAVGVRLLHGGGPGRPHADHPAPKPPHRRLRGLPDRSRHRRLPGQSVRKSSERATSRDIHFDTIGSIYSEPL